MSSIRYPVMQQCLRLANQIAPNGFANIVDIGVQSRTEFLVDVFPDRTHHLFEPVTTYRPRIEAYYTKHEIPYKYYPCALGDADGTLWLHKTSNDGSGNVTHSQLRATREETMRHLLEIEEIEARKLDSVFAPGALADLSYLVKLDVDGVEERIINGGQRVIGNASMVVIECSIGRQDLLRRAAMLEELGFRIYDICDNAYFYGQLAIVDLVMINNRFRDTDDRFRPWERTKGLVDWSKWQHGFKHLSDAEFDDPFA